MAVKDITDVQVVQACMDYHAKGLPFSLYRLMETTGQCEKVCYRAMERADRKGLIDFGVSLRSAWATDEGKKLLGR